MESIKSKTIEELMDVFDVIYDEQDHPIFTNEFGEYITDEFGSYDEAFGAWIAYELMNEEAA